MTARNDKPRGARGSKAEAAPGGVEASQRDLSALAAFMRRAWDDAPDLDAFGALEGDHMAARDALEQFLELSEARRIVPTDWNDREVVQVLRTTRRIVERVLQRDDAELKRVLGYAEARKAPKARLQHRVLCSAVDFALAMPMAEAAHRDEPAAFALVADVLSSDENLARMLGGERSAEYIRRIYRERDDP